MERTKKYKYVDDYLLKIRSKGRFSFTFEKLNQTFDSSDNVYITLKKEGWYDYGEVWMMRW